MKTFALLFLLDKEVGLRKTQFYCSPIRIQAKSCFAKIKTCASLPFVAARDKGLLPDIVGAWEVGVWEVAISRWCSLEGERCLYFCFVSSRNPWFISNRVRWMCCLTASSRIRGNIPEYCLFRQSF